MQILILFAHPAFQKSKVNKELVGVVKKISNITFHDLYEEYPDLTIDVKREQKLLTQHDLIVFMHPLFWYSTPSILKEWQELVLQHGWAYGSKGNMLKGKYFCNFITTGAPKIAYTHEGLHGHTLVELLAPVFQTASHCKMKVLPPFVVHGTFAIEQKEIEEYKTKLKLLLTFFSKHEIDFEKANECNYLNNYRTED